MRRWLSGLALTLVAISQTTAQRLESYIQFAYISARESAEAIPKYFGKSDIKPTVRCGATLYRVQYWSTDLKGEVTLLSGLVAVPDQPIAMGTVVYLHGATAIRSNVPSRMSPTNGNSPETWIAFLALGTGGYVFVAPDYLGLGINSGFHPFALGSLNTLAASDLVLAADELLEKLSMKSLRRLYVTGYSEGGAIAMWLIRKLQAIDDPRLRVTAGAPISGPYDLSGVQTRSMIGKQNSLVKVALRLFFAAYFCYGLQENQRWIKLEDCFSTPIASYIPLVWMRSKSDEELVQKLALKGIQQGSVVSIRRALTPSFLDMLENWSKDSKVARLLAENDCFDWSPTQPLYLLGLSTDYVVPMENTLVAARAMRKRGVLHDKLNFHSIAKEGLDHLNAMGPLLSLARKFFDRGFAGVPCDPIP